MVGLFVGCGIGWAAAPAQAAEGVRLSGTAGWAGRCHAGRSIPVRAVISADRLVSGVLSVEVMGPTAAVTEVPVEVAGGTEEEVVLVVSTPLGCGGLTLRLREGRGTTTAQVGTTDAGDTVLLGLLPGARPGTTPPSAVARTGVAAVAALEPDLLDRPGAVAGLDSIGTSPADLDGLAVEGRRALVSWVAAGGTLLVDAEGPEALGALPEVWRPSAGARRQAGHGQVRLTGSALRDGRLDGLAEPGAAASRDQGGGFQMSGGTLGGFLQRRSGLRVLSLPVILGALGFYVVVVGPGARVVLRRLGRLQLTWLVVPVAALAFSGLAVAGGDILRRGGKPTHLSVVETEAAGAGSRTYVGVPTRSKGKVTVDLPTGWLDAPGLEDRQAPTTIRATPAGQRVQVDGRPGGFVVIGAEGPSLVDGRLMVRLDPDGRHGTVQNQLRIPLEDVAVFGPGAVAALGRLEPGATTPFTMPASSGPIDASSLANQVWGGSGQRLADPQAFAMLAGVQRGFGLSVGLSAAGWTDQLASPLALRSGRPSGATLILGRPTDGPPLGEPVGSLSSGLAITRFVVAPGSTYRLSLTQGGFGGPGFGGPGFGGPGFGGPGFGGPGFGGGPRPGRGSDGPEVLVGGRWVAASDEAALPDGASSDGVVYVRSPLGPPFQPTLAAT